MRSFSVLSICHFVSAEDCVTEQSSLLQLSRARETVDVGVASASVLTRVVKAVTTISENAHEMCVDAFPGERAPLSGDFIFKDTSHRVKVESGAISPAHGKFCIDMQRASLLQRSYGLLDATTVETALANKVDQGNGVEGTTTGKAGGVESSAQGKDKKPEKKAEKTILSNYGSYMDDFDAGNYGVLGTKYFNLPSWGSGRTNLLWTSAEQMGGLYTEVLKPVRDAGWTKTEWTSRGVEEFNPQAYQLTSVYTRRNATGGAIGGEDLQSRYIYLKTDLGWRIAFMDSQMTTLTDVTIDDGDQQAVFDHYDNYLVDLNQNDYLAVGNKYFHLPAWASTSKVNEIFKTAEDVNETYTEQLADLKFRGWTETRINSREFVQHSPRLADLTVNYTRYGVNSEVGRYSIGSKYSVSHYRYLKVNDTWKFAFLASQMTDLE